MANTDPSSKTHPRRILVSGSTGLLGQRIVAHLRAAGETVVPLVRAGGPADAVRWNPADDSLDPDAVSGFDAVIHLAGEPIANGRWSAAKKGRIRESRVNGTARLAAALARAERPPAVFLCASGINVYGDHGDAIVDEATPPGPGFLPEVCTAWEAAAAPLAGISRIVFLRIGVVLTTDGGTLAAMLPLFRRGLGGVIGGGRAYVSWVTLEDLVRVVDYALRSEGLSGPVNVTSPDPVTGRAFAMALGAAVGRPVALPVPAWLIRLAMGELAEETVLSSVRAIPRRLTADGFFFLDETIQAALVACGAGKP